MSPPDTEGMTCRICVHLMSCDGRYIVSYFQGARTKFHRPCVCLTEVIYMEVKVNLLRVPIGPIGGLMIRC